MARDVKFIILNVQDDFALDLRSTLLHFDGVKVIAEVDDPALLAPAVNQFRMDVLMVNLDPSPEAILPMLSQVASARRDLPIFATSASTDGQLILKTMRIGIREFFPKPIETAALGEAIDRVAVERVHTVQHGKLISVIGTSGGVGSTVVATNLAAELASLVEGKVAVVDLDYRFGQVATLLDIQPTYTLADLCGSPEALETSVIERALTKHVTGVHVLSRPQSFGEAEMITGASCTGVLTNLLAMNQYVVTDGPTRFDLGAAAVLALADVNLLVVKLLVPCVRNALRILEGMRTAGYNLDRTKLVCNRVGRDAGHLSPSQVAETLGLDVFASIPDDLQTVSAAINLGEPLRSHSPKSKVRIALQEVAERLHRPEGTAEDKDGRKKGGLIGRIFANT